MRLDWALPWPAARLQVIAYPSCFLTTPDDPVCGQGVVVPSVNDVNTQTVTFSAGQGGDFLHFKKEVERFRRRLIEQIRMNRLCELNVVRQVRNVASDVFVQDARARGQEICVHGWVYSLSNGLVIDLNLTVSGPD